MVKHQLNSKTSTCLSRVTKTIKVSDIYRLVKKSYFNSIQILLEIIFGKFDLFLEFWVLKTLKSTLFVWEKVTTTNLTTSKTKKEHQKICKPSLHQKSLFRWSLLWHHYIKNGFLVDHYIEIDKDHYYKNQNVKKNVKRTSKVSVLSDFHILTTYGISTYGIFGFLGVNK